MVEPHVHEDDLTLLHYDELGPAERRAIQAHLDGCAACRARQEELAQVLAMVDDAGAPEPDAAFEARAWARLQPALRASRGAQARVERQPEPVPEPVSLAARIAAWLAPPAVGRWALAGGVAVLVAAAFLAGRWWPAAPAGPAAPASAELAVDGLRERVLLSALGDHFDRSETVLVDLAGTAPGDRVSIAAEQRRAAELLAATRLYRRAAVEAGDGNVADVLESLQRILVEVTGSPSELSAFELQALQHRIQTQELLFKLRIASSAVRNRESRTRQAGPRATTGA